MSINNVSTLKLLSVLEMASYAHRAQRRSARHKSNRLPYIHHPIQVANKIAEAIEHKSSLDILNMFGIDWIEPTILAAILHDVIEDTDIAEDDVIHIAGKCTASIVLEVTDADDMPSDTKLRKSLQAEKAKTYSIGATNLKISDQTSNLNDVRLLMPRWTKDKIIAYSEGASKVVFSTPEHYRLPLLIELFNESVKSLYQEIDNIATDP